MKPVRDFNGSQSFFVCFLGSLGAGWFSTIDARTMSKSFWMQVLNPRHTRKANNTLFSINMPLTGANRLPKRFMIFRRFDCAKWSSRGHKNWFCYFTILDRGFMDSFILILLLNWISVDCSFKLNAYNYYYMRPSLDLPDL